MNDVSRLALGTVQFGLDYGITNARGRVPDEEVAAILADAFAQVGADAQGLAGTHCHDQGGPHIGYNGARVGSEVREG